MRITTYNSQQIFQKRVSYKSYLDPVEDIDILPAAVRVKSQFLVLCHHLASRDLDVGLDLS